MKRVEVAADLFLPEPPHTFEGHVPVAELRAMCCENAAALYRRPLPDVVLPLTRVR